MNIIGHQEQKERWQTRFEEGHFPQSLLFCGPEGVGKFTLAFALASELVGVRGFEPTEGAPTPQDMMVIEPEIEVGKTAVKTKRIKVETVRAAREFLQQFPSMGRYRVVVIRDAHLLSEEAQNALLKTLEEPNASSVLMLVTHEPEQLLPTLTSRLVRESFGLVPAEALQKEFPEKTLEASGIPIFFRELGRPGVLVTALAHPQAFIEEKEKLTKLYRLSLLSVAERLQFAEELSKNIPQTQKLLAWWLPGLHERANQEYEPKRLAKYFQLLSEIDRVLVLLKTTNAQPRLLLEQLFLGI